MSVLDGSHLRAVVDFDPEDLMRGLHSPRYALPPERLVLGALQGDGQWLSAAIPVDFVVAEYFDQDAPPVEDYYSGALVIQMRLDGDDPRRRRELQSLALCEQFLYAALREGRRVLKRYTKSDDSVTWALPNELAREAGRHLMGKVFGDPSSTGLFEIFATVSTLKYEGALSVGAVAFVPTVKDLSVAFLSPIAVTDAKATRKLLEMCTSKHVLLAVNGEVLGLVRRDDIRDTGVIVHFEGDGLWRMDADGILLMKVRHGSPSYPIPRVNRAEFTAIFDLLFGDVDSDAEGVWALVEAATQQTHGALLIITRVAASETQRLAATSTATKPQKLAPELVSAVTSIDGAVLLTPGAECHAIGVILDGEASSRGTSKRGSRFNSALTYVDTNPGSMALIVSEDGDVELAFSAQDEATRRNRRAE